MKKNILAFLAITFAFFLVDAQADVSLGELAGSEQCEIIQGETTTDAALSKLLKEYGASAKVLNPTAFISATQQRAAIVELPTKDGRLPFLLVDGSLEHCNNLLEMIRARTATQERLAAKWVRVGSTTDGRTDFVDIRSARKDQSGLVHLWVKQEFSKPYRGPNEIRYSEAIVSLALNCQEHTTAATALGYYDKRGRLLLRAEQEQSKWRFTESAPESLQRVLLRAHCN